MNETDYLLIITVAGIGAGVLQYIVKKCYTTKCSKINLGWGCIEIDRNIEEETKEYRRSMQLGLNSVDTHDNRQATIPQPILHHDV